MADIKRDSQTSNDSVEMGEVDRKNEKTNGEINHESLDYHPTSWLETTLMRVSNSTDDFMKKNRSSLRIFYIFLLNGLVIGFFIGCLYYYLSFSTEPLEICHGFGSLIAFLGIIYAFVIYFLVVKRFLGKWFCRIIWKPICRVWASLWKYLWFKVCFMLAVAIAVVLFLYIDTKDSPERLISLIGLGFLMLMGFVFSAHPGRIVWRTVLMGLLIQFIFGLLFIRWDDGRIALQCFSDKSVTIVHDRLIWEFSSDTLPVIFFVSMLVEILFFWGALQWVCLKLGQILQAATKTTVCESVIAVGNVFLGMSESVLMIKPYLPLLTPSEMHIVMSSGFATVSGTILAAYIGFGAEPAHLVTASVMSAPAAICYGKLLLPETKRSLTTVDNIQPVVCEDQSVLSAATRGATNGISLILNIIANIVAFVAFIAFLNGFLGYCGGLLGYPELNLEWIMGKIFIPLCWAMGVPWEECELVGTLIGLKTVVNEFVAYQRMGEMKRDGLLSPRSELIATYSLCGFTNPGSAGIMIGAISAMAPNQRETLSSVF
ncbi:hypothetical protein K1T71_014111 [Dendrolimus kikuchii]|uniref:Uncharacterized protein n=1 Tax=Dendrolimus kikuchii TaxID=765133 RepID=A0ACC1CF39_9NEOP|nr:hypothetical protein K1T71_014111 [Dendrolimus kikuchii]